MEIAGVVAFSTASALRGLLPSNSLGHGQRINLVTWLEDNPLIGMRKRWKIKTRNKSKLDPPSHCNPPILLGVQNSALIFGGVVGWCCLGVVEKEPITTETAPVVWGESLYIIYSKSQSAQQLAHCYGLWLPFFSTNPPRKESQPGRSSNQNDS